MKFRCKNCGVCCSDVTAPVNLTLGDIQRIIGFLGVKVDKIFGKEIGIVPFANPDKPLMYDLDLGINMPCRFRINEKCRIYRARPLNCRIFPYWVLSHPDKDGYKRYIDTVHKGIIGYKEDSLNKKKYNEYRIKIGNIILDESAITDEFLSEKDLKVIMNLPESYRDLKERERIEFCRNMMNKERYKDLPLILKKELGKHRFISVEELEKIDLIL